MGRRGHFGDQIGEPAHVGEDDGPGAFEPFRRGEAACIPEGAHAGGAGGLHAVPAVFNHDAAGGPGAHPVGSVQEQVGGRLAPGDLGGAEDTPGEVLVQSGTAQGVAHLVVAAAGGHADRKADPGEGIGDAVHGPQPGVYCLGVQAGEAALDLGRELGAEPGLDQLVDGGSGAPDETLGHLLLGNGPAELAEHPRVGAHGDRLAVHQDPVAVEDHQIGHPATIAPCRTPGSGDPGPGASPS